MKGEKYRFGANKYRYGFQSQEQDSELWEGAVTYKYRVEDPRLGRFFSVDPLYAKFPHNSTYAFSENRLLDAIELEGLEARLIITDQIVGYTPQHIYGDGEKALEKSAIVVPVYLVLLVDAQNPEIVVGYCGVTRDAFYSLGLNDENDKSKGVELANRACEPTKDKVYETQPLTYPTAELEAYALRENGKENIQCEPQSPENQIRNDGEPIDKPRYNVAQATGVMFHIGGWYAKGNTEKLGGSYGCFGFIEQDQIYATQADAQSMIDNNAMSAHGTSNLAYGQFIELVKNVQSSTNGAKTVQIELQKREGVNVKETISIPAK
jgi:RHS repeat-associated protein